MKPDNFLAFLTSFIASFGVPSLALSILCLAGCAAQPDTAQISDSDLNVAVVALQNHNAQLAQNVANAILEKNPMDVGALNIQSQAYYGVADLENAQKSALKALAVDNKNAEAHMNLGRALDQQDPFSAIRQFRIALALSPGLESANIDIGVAQDQLGQVDAAVDTFENDISLYPDDTVAKLDLGIALTLRHGNGDMDQAKAVLNPLGTASMASDDEKAAWQYVSTQN